MRGTLSVVIITKDEERNIRECLTGVSWADEIIIVDDESTDRTREICREFTDKIFVKKMEGFGVQKQYGIDKATGDWVLVLDADERLPPGLQAAVRQVVERGSEYDGFLIWRKTFYAGKWIRHCGWYEPTVRLFKRTAGACDLRPVHEMIVVRGRIGRLDEPLLHETYRDIAHHVAKMNAYSGYDARIAYDRGVRVRGANAFWYCIVKPVVSFARKYVIQRGFLDGMQGFLISASTAIVVFFIYAKVWEMDRCEGVVPAPAAPCVPTAAPDIVSRFVDVFSREKKADAGQAEQCRLAAEKFYAYAGSGPLTEADAARYLETEQSFVVEEFLRFFDKEGAVLDSVRSGNRRVFKTALVKRPVTARDYDERIAMQSLRFQIDNYYEPRAEDMKRRIGIVMAALDPRAGETVLDVGCGVGTFAYHSVRKGARSFGVDYSLKSVEVARALARHFGMADRATYECCDAIHALPFAAGSFDKIVAADFIEHITDAEKALLLREMARVLKPGGRVVIFTPNRIREWLGACKAILGRLAGSPADETRLHYGLIDRFSFERMLTKQGFRYVRQFHDVKRPYLAKIPLARELLSLDLLWVATR